MQPDIVIGLGIAIGLALSALVVSGVALVFAVKAFTWRVAAPADPEARGEEP